MTTTSLKQERVGSSYGPMLGKNYKVCFNILCRAKAGLQLLVWKIVKKKKKVQ